MLDRLLAYATGRDLDAEPGFSAKRVRWGIACDPAGRFLELLPLGGDKGRRFPKCPDTPAMNAGGRSHFLVESLATLALWPPGPASPLECQRHALKLDFFCQLLERAEPILPGLAGAARMLRDPLQRQRLHAELRRQGARPIDLATPLVEDRLPLAEEGWHAWWRTQREHLSGAGDRTPLLPARDLLTGQPARPLRTHPRIKGLGPVGGLLMGDVMIGFDKQAFQSYGLEQSANAAMSAESAARYAAALNHLIAERGVRLGGSLLVYWYPDAAVDSDLDDPLDRLLQPAAQADARPGEAPRPAPADGHGGRYHALLLSGARGRIMVRDWQEGHRAELRARVAAWFADLEMVSREGVAGDPPRFLALAGALAPDLETLPAHLLLGLWRAALGGGPLPRAVLAQAVRRTSAELLANQPPNPARMALMRAHLVRGGKIAMGPRLNPDHPSTAYQCGRLLAVLANLRRAALGEGGMAMVHRHYAVASHTPARVIGRLVGQAKAHLGRLREPGLAAWFEERLAEIMGRVGDQLPGLLDLEQQSLFALGYYQQLAAMRARKELAPPDQERAA